MIPKNLRVGRRIYESRGYVFGRSIPGGRERAVPYVRISGDWLVRLGFTIGAELEVEARPDEGALVLRTSRATGQTRTVQ